MIREILAYVFRKLNLNKRSRTFDLMDLKITMLFELGLASEEQLNQLLEQARAQGLIEITDDGKVIPLFDYMSVEIPTNIKQLASSISVKENLVDKILSSIAEQTGEEIERLKKELEALQKDYPIFYPEVLAVYLAFIKGADVSQYLDLVKNFVKLKNLEFDEI